MQVQYEPLPQHSLLAPKGLYLITEDQLSVAPQVALLLQQKGASTAILTSAVLADPDRLDIEVNQLRQTYGSVSGIVHLAGLSVTPTPVVFSAWRQATQTQAKSLFQILHLCASDLQQAGQRQSGQVLAASLLGGHFGRNGLRGPGLPAGGSNTGLLKTANKEWSIPAKAVDFDNSQPPLAIAQQIVQELLLPGGRIEVGYPQGQRTIFQTVPAPLAKTVGSAQLEPAGDWVVLITGGGRGITAAIASQLARPGMTMILVGRTPEPTEESSATAGITEVAVLRQVCITQSLAQGLSPTPVQIERQVQSLLHNRTVHHNLQGLRQAGVKVEYHSVDVRDPDAFRTLIQGVYTRYGRLDAVIHGAGVIEDKLIADKSTTSFERVFDVKVDSTFILSQNLQPDSLKLLVLFSSVAGRYGNRGQADYAAANEVMNRLAWQLDQQWPQTRVVAINWGPWDTPGMASEEVKNQFRKQGVTPIQLESGCQFFMEELHYGVKGEVEVIAGEGPWESHEAEQGQLKSLTSLEEQQRFVFPVAGAQLQPNSTVTLEHTFSLNNDPYLQDHCLDGKPVLPAAAAAEWLAEFIQAAWTDWTVSAVKDLRVLRGFVFEKDGSRKALLRARASSHADATGLEVTAEILDADQKAPFYRAVVVLSPRLDVPPGVQTLPLTSGIPLEPKTAYHNYLFHGPRFQLLTSIDRLNELGIDAQVMPSRPSLWSNQVLSQPSTSTWLFDPGLIDTAAQLALVWTRVHQGASALPSRFGEIIRYGSPNLYEPLTMAFRVKANDGSTITYDVSFTDQGGHVCLHLIDFESTCSAALNRLNVVWRAENGLS